MYMYIYIYINIYIYRYSIYIEKNICKAAYQESLLLSRAHRLNFLSAFGKVFRFYMFPIVSPQVWWSVLGGLLQPRKQSVGEGF